ncbi:MAG: hypothetical protein COV07_00640 [Candidatus Vogelbacteria bacterium CG10_big_fil_rev_8_21_14_0_10_45_14]|uniref:Uncharacterized protein n=1 Tax=Candidatus Vogelbacteria bacterium CG10_big_fil_rev_8_21_14_0_10_45_14 TaxID=1975042 RepID=A0A2H0RL62_9BACT|nr:MAG: hypothetical protein COV07_00640 [Candidatus Vogelbacteria bacterium CG10_big_fil_rev_8_21_14_0_10_45_14]
MSKQKTKHDQDEGDEDFSGFEADIAGRTEVDNSGLDEDTKGLMSDYDIDEETADRVLALMEEYGIDEDDALELEQEV